MLDVSRQAYVYTVILIITSLINLVVSGSLFGLTGFLGYIIIFIIAVPFMLLSIYNIDCLTSGGCEIWSWIWSIISCISLLGTTILMVFAGIMKEKLQSN